jgi:hypothetical protein
LVALASSISSTTDDEMLGARDRGYGAIGRALVTFAGVAALLTVSTTEAVTQIGWTDSTLSTASGALDAVASVDYGPESVVYVWEDVWLSRTALAVRRPVETSARIVPAFGWPDLLDGAVEIRRQLGIVDVLSDVADRDDVFLVVSESLYVMVEQYLREHHSRYCTQPQVIAEVAGKLVIQRIREVPCLGARIEM